VGEEGEGEEARRTEMEGLFSLEEERPVRRKEGRKDGRRDKRGRKSGERVEERARREGGR